MRVRPHSIVCRPYGAKIGDRIPNFNVDKALVENRLSSPPSLLLRDSLRIAKGEIFHSPKSPEISALLVL